ncbi:MAG: hypothetical protein MJE68_08255 [Proteobacteria bacterium]|nr:hypothetical protein [Pseudomonadota bacterium]
MRGRPAKLEHNRKAGIIQYLVAVRHSCAAEALVPYEEKRANERYQTHQMEYFPSTVLANALVRPHSNERHKHSACHLRYDENMTDAGVRD